MKIAIAGGHGQIAMMLHPLLREHGHSVMGLIRNANQADAVSGAGATPVVCDLEATADLASVVSEVDAVVFAAGAGPGSGADRKVSMDRNGAVRLIDAAKRSNVSRYVMISAIRAEQARGDDVFRTYLQAKSEADEALRRSGLDYTIIRPGRLTNDAGSGLVQIGPTVPMEEIPRADVAAVVAEVLDTPSTIGQQFELVTGQHKIRQALAALR